MKTFSDERLDQMCSYCGETANETRDHVPSKILLDIPFPENLPVVPCCTKCNNSFSLDEEYFACAIECILWGTTDIEKLQREKIKSILKRKLKLKQQIQDSFVLQQGEIFFKFDETRFINVVTKLAKGHFKFENSEAMFDEPTSITMKPLMLFTENETKRFFDFYESNILPEVGSRAFQNLFMSDNNGVNSNWITVQDKSYKYSVTHGIELFTVRIVVWNYLAVQAIWDNNKLNG